MRDFRSTKARASPINRNEDGSGTEAVGVEGVGDGVIPGVGAGVVVVICSIDIEVSMPAND